MTWEDFTLARQLEVEMEIGARVREAKQIETAQAKKTRTALSRGAR